MIRRWRTFLGGNLGYKALSVLIAVSTWLYVQGETQQIAYVQAETEWLLGEGIKEVQPLPSRLTLTIQGSRSAVRKVKGVGLRIPIDISEFTPGDYAIDPAAYPVADVPASIEIVSISPAPIGFTLAELIERNVSIRPVFVGTPKDGHVIESLELEPSAVLLIGPRSVLAAVDEVSTVPMDLTDWSEARRQEVRLDLPHGVSLSDQTKVFANISIESLFVDRSFSEVPVFLNQADDWVVDPLSISVALRGPRTVMRRMESSDVTALVRVETGQTEGQYSATIDGTQQAFVEISHGGGEAVEVLSIDPSAISVSRP